MLPNPPSDNASSRLLIFTGVSCILFAAIFTTRILWEETILTLRQGPQMIGFSLAHGSWAILFFSPILLAIWLLFALSALVIRLIRKRKLSKGSPHAAELMTDDAAEGNARTVRAYLNHGVPISATNDDGATAAYTAAAGGSLPVLKMLAARGADLNATNLYGDSPLEAAVENRHTVVAEFLRAHGAQQIKGTPEQHQAAASAIVRREIEKEHSR